MTSQKTQKTQKFISFGDLPSRFLVNYENHTFVVKLERPGFLVSRNFVLQGEDEGYVVLSMEDNYIGWNEPDGKYVCYLFKGLVRDTEHPSPVAYRIIGMNRHFRDSWGETHCDCPDCPVPF